MSSSSSFGLEAAEVIGGGGGGVSVGQLELPAVYSYCTVTKKTAECSHQPLIPQTPETSLNTVLYEGYVLYLHWQSQVSGFSGARIPNERRREGTTTVLESLPPYCPVQYSTVVLYEVQPDDIPPSSHRTSLPTNGHPERSVRLVTVVGLSCYIQDIYPFSHCCIVPAVLRQRGPPPECRS